MMAATALDPMSHTDSEAYYSRPLKVGAGYLKVTTTVAAVQVNDGNQMRP
jgi:hypothetical protein